MIHAIIRRERKSSQSPMVADGGRSWNQVGALQGSLLVNIAHIPKVNDLRGASAPHEEMAFWLQSASARAFSSTAQQNRPPLSFEQIAQIVNSTDRTAADRTNDVRRKPKQMLGFIVIHPGIVAVDLSAGGGYTTELLARAIGPSGKVYGQSRPRDPSQISTPSVAPEGNSNPVTTPSAASAAPASAPRLSPVALAERENNLRAHGVQAAPIVALSQPFEDPFPSELAVERIDLVTLMFNYHDLVGSFN